MLLALLGAAPPAGLTAQEPTPAPPPAPAATDTTEAQPPISPLGAFGRSMILPGWGQLEVGQPSRAAVYFGLESVFLFMVFKSDGRLSAAKEERPANEERISNRTGQRENWIVLAGFVAFMSGLDAWVSAQFWDFEPIVAPPLDGGSGLTLGMRLPVP